MTREPDENYPTPEAEQAERAEALKQRALELGEQLWAQIEAMLDQATLLARSAAPADLRDLDAMVASLSRHAADLPTPPPEPRP